MSKYNIFQAIFMSFYSRKLYHDVGQHWGGKTFLYLFLLLALSWVGQTIGIQKSLGHLYASQSGKFVSQIPVVIVTQGKLSTPANKPYIIKEPGASKAFAIIDTSGKYTDITKSDASLLITATQIISRPNEEEVRIYKIPSVFSATINPVSINEHVKSGISFAWIFIFTCLLVLSYIYRIIQVLLYSIIGKIFSAISHSHVNYGTIMQITMVAITPSLVLATVLDLLMYKFPYQHLTYFLLAMIYMIYGIRANKS